MNHVLILFCTNYLKKFSIDLNRIWHTVVICWCDEPYTHFISSIQWREPYLSDFGGGGEGVVVWFFFLINIGLYSDIYGLIFFQTWYVDKDH